MAEGQAEMVAAEVLGQQMVPQVLATQVVVVALVGATGFRELTADRV